MQTSSIWRSALLFGSLLAACLASYVAMIPPRFVLPGGFGLGIAAQLPSDGRTLSVLFMMSLVVGPLVWRVSWRGYVCFDWVPVLCRGAISGIVSVAVLYALTIMVVPTFILAKAIATDDGISDAFTLAPLLTLFVGLTSAFLAALPAMIPGLVAGLSSAALTKMLGWVTSPVHRGSRFPKRRDA